MTLRLPRLQATGSVVGPDGRPASAFQIWWQSVVQAIEQAFADIVAVNERQDELIGDLADAVEAIRRAQEAAEAAAEEAKRAQQEAAAAQEAAAMAQQQAENASQATGEVNTYAEQLEERIRALEGREQEQ